MYKLLSKINFTIEVNKTFKYINNRLISSKKNSLNLSGVFPPIITPFNKHEEIAFDKLKYNLEKWKSVPLSGFVVLGTTGEYASLTDKEKINLIKCVRNSAPAEKLVIAGSGCESTSATIKLTNEMADAGANAVLVINPYYNKSRMAEDVLCEHFIKVADSSKIPVLIYNAPGNTGIDIPPSLLIKLADHPNVIGMKESGGDVTKIGFVVHKTRDKDFQVLAGAASFLYSALCLGCVGGIMGLANSLPKEVYMLYQLAVDGKHDEACNLQYKLIGPNLSIRNWFGIPGLKASMDLLGFYGGPCRSPLKSLSSTDMKKLIDEFKTNGFL